jgi:hypothetical protein
MRDATLRIPDYGKHSTEDDQVPGAGKELEPKAEVAIVGLGRNECARSSARSK